MTGTATPRFAWERAVRKATLGTRDASVALVLATYADADGSRVHPGIKGVATGLGVSERTVERTVASLVARGYVVKVREGNHRRGKADEYQLTLPDHPTAVTGSPDTGDRSADSRDGSPDTRVAPPVQVPAQAPDPHQNNTIATAEEPEDVWAEAERLWPMGK